MSRPEKTDEEFYSHFWGLAAKKHQCGPTECWMWRGGRDGRGYGCIWRRGTKHRAHRISYQLSTGRKIPKGKLICHTCDNKLCVNPEHLFVGTHKDNMQDWTRKGKNILINHPELLPRGKDHWTQKRTKQTKANLKKLSLARKKEWRSGQRTAIRDSRGRIMGTRMVSQ